MHEEPLICFQISFKLKKLFLMNYLLIMTPFQFLSFYKHLAEQNSLGRLTYSHKSKAEPTATFMCLDTARANVISVTAFH